MSSRYSRHHLLEQVGVLGQQKISSAKVLVVGAGGLGCPVLQYLTAAGVGVLGIIDFDVVEESNLQRQVLFGVSNIGQNKALAAKARLQDLNPLVHFNTYTDALTTQNAITIFKDYDIIVDGTDNFSTRYLINDACILTEKPLVYGAIFKFEGQVAVFNHQNGPSYRCLFASPPDPGARPSCSAIGVLGVLPGIIGSMQANEVLKIILELGDVLSGKLLLYNALQASSMVVSVAKNPQEIQKIKHRNSLFTNKEYAVFCGAPTQQITTISTATFIEKASDSKVVFIDVREQGEYPKITQIPVKDHPLSTLAAQELPYALDASLVLFCKSGVRSKRAAVILQEKGFTDISVLQASVVALQQEIETSFSI